MCGYRDSSTRGMASEMHYSVPPSDWASIKIITRESAQIDAENYLLTPWTALGKLSPAGHLNAKYLS